MPATEQLRATAPRFVSLLAAAQPATEEEGGGVWVPVLPIGEWDTSRQWYEFGVEYLRLAEADMQEFAANFAANVIGRDIYVDEEHRGGKSFGWLKAMRVDAEGLWSRVLWTPLGQEAVDNQLYRYISAEFNPAAFPWFDSTTGKKIPNVISSIALTNDPFFKMAPVAKRAPDTSARRPEAFVGLAISERSSAMPGPIETNPAPETGAKPDPALTGAATAEALTAENADLKAKLAVSEAALDAAKTQGSDLTKRVGDLEASVARREIRSRLAAMRFGENGSRCIASAHVDKLTESAMELPAAKRDAFLAQVEETVGKGIVPIGELGSSQAQPAPTAGSPGQAQSDEDFGITAEDRQKYG